MDTYCENIVKKKKGTSDYIIIFATVVMTTVLIYILTGFISHIPSISFLIPAVWFGTIWAAYKIVSFRNIEYEYLLTGGDLDVDKIVNRSKRSPIISVRRREIEFVAPLGSNHIPVDWQNVQKIDVSSGYNTDLVYVLAINKEGRKLVLFEPTEKMKEQLKLKLSGKIFFE